MYYELDYKLEYKLDPTTYSIPDHEDILKRIQSLRLCDYTFHDEYQNFDFISGLISLFIHNKPNKENSQLFIDTLKDYISMHLENNRFVDKMKSYMYALIADYKVFYDNIIDISPNVDIDKIRRDISRKGLSLVEVSKKYDYEMSVLRKMNDNNYFKSQASPFLLKRAIKETSLEDVAIVEGFDIKILKELISDNN